MMRRDLAQDLLCEFGSPLYLYDLERFEGQARTLQAILPRGARLIYAMKANPLPAICGALREAGCDTEVSSPAELAIAREAGFDSERILYTGPGKTEEEVRGALAAGVCRFSCDSAEDLRRLAGVAGAGGWPAEALLRLNVAGSPYARFGVGAFDAHFGVLEAEVLAAAGELAAAGRVEIAGVHVYFGTQIPAPEGLVETFAGALETAERVAVHSGLELRVVDVGGGFPWPFATDGSGPELAGLAPAFERAASQRRLTAGADLWFESGRYLAAAGGTLLATVLAVKTAGGKKFVVLDAGVNHLGGMAGLGRIHRPLADPVPLEPRAGEAETVDLVGPTDSALDCVARGVAVSPLGPGDRVAIPNVGAYGLTASLLGFAGRRAAVEVCHRGETVVAAYRYRTGHERIA